MALINDNIRAIMNKWNKCKNNRTYFLNTNKNFNLTVQRLRPDSIKSLA